MVAWFSVDHPKLPDWGDGVRDIRSSHRDLEREYGEAMRPDDIAAVRKKMAQREDEDIEKRSRLQADRNSRPGGIRTQLAGG